MITVRKRKDINKFYYTYNFLARLFPKPMIYNRGRECKARRHRQA